MSTSQLYWSRLDANEMFDIVVIGGGITGAGIFREAVRAGLKALLVERYDFAWGTSSRSSKLVHGGIRYLKQGNLALTRESVLERERLLAESQDLVKPLSFLAPTYRRQKPGRLAFKAGVGIYNTIAGHWARMSFTTNETHMMAPHLRELDLTGGLRYLDARADDARLVLRLISEACRQGGQAMNRVTAQKPSLLSKTWHLPLEFEGELKEVRARVVVNATGVHANALRHEATAAIRPLRGSHLVFPAWRLPSPQAITILHPRDNRPIFLLPWEGATLFGTTDVDHHDDPKEEPRPSKEELLYLIEGLQAHFPSMDLSLRDVVSVFAGVRPVLSAGKKDPSKESRDHKIWDEHGLLTITGGKLTTFRAMAAQLLQRARPYLPHFPGPSSESVFSAQLPDWPVNADLTPEVRARLRARFGPRAGAVAESARPGELHFIDESETLWVELRWAAQHEWVMSLDDLLLRRVRLGLLLPEGAAAILPAVLEICQQELGWDPARCAQETKAYQERIARCYSVPKELLTEN